MPESKAIVKTIDEIIKEAKVPSPENKTPLPNIINKQEAFPNFTAATFEDSGIVPPDAMGVVGPAQFIIGANGRVRSFDKATGKTDGAIDISTGSFFRPISKGSLTSDSRIRYDRFSDRWYIVILDLVPSPARIIMLAVSDSGIVNLHTKWSFFSLTPRADKTPDYPTIGIDKHAVYIGANIMDENFKYLTSDAIVIQKKALLEGILKATLFKDLVLSKNFTGPTTPQGVDNFDENSSDGYFIGIDGLNKQLMLRRIKDPGGVPSISDNIPIPVDGAIWPLQVPQKGSLKSKKFMLQGFDNRLCSPHIRNNQLYTGHNVAVDNKGSDTTTKPTRDGCKWFEISLDDPDRPKITQSGILYQPSKENDGEERYYWTPGIMTNGLLTMMICCSTSGDQEFANAAYALRYSNDPLGKMREPHLFTHSHVVYTLGFPPFEILRWGEYSHASVDPLDNMTFWTIAEFSYKENSWGLQVVRIPAGPPAKVIRVNPANAKTGEKKVHLTISGISENGSAFYDPGKSFPKRLKLEIEDIIVESILKVTPEEIEAVVSIGEKKGAKMIKITNPDGQFVEVKGMLRVD